MVSRITEGSSPLSAAIALNACANSVLGVCMSRKRQSKVLRLQSAKNNIIFCPMRFALCAIKKGGYLSHHYKKLLNLPKFYSENDSESTKSQSFFLKFFDRLF